MNSRRVNSEADRARIRAFFDAHLDDRTGFALQSRAFDAQIGIPSILRIVEGAEGDIIAAIYASNNPEDALRWRMQGQNEPADVIADEMLMIHDVAVAKRCRRRGLGRQLVNAVVDDARMARASLVALTFNDTQSGLDEFYRGLGFQVLDRGDQLKVDFAALPFTIGFPQSDRRYRWAYRILDRTRIRT